VSFYCKYILGIKEPAEVEENINPMTFGNLAHSILEKIYPQSEILHFNDLIFKLQSRSEKNLSYLKNIKRKKLGY